MFHHPPHKQKNLYLAPVEVISLTLSLSGYEANLIALWFKIT